MSPNLCTYLCLCQHSHMCRHLDAHIFSSSVSIYIYIYLSIYIHTRVRTSVLLSCCGLFRPRTFDDDMRELGSVGAMRTPSSGCTAALEMWQATDPPARQSMFCAYMPFGASHKVPGRCWQASFVPRGSCSYHSGLLKKTFA